MAAPNDAGLTGSSTPAAPSDGLRERFVMAMRRRSDTVHIISYRGGDDAIRGLTATAVVSVSADPPTMLVCIHRDARSHDDITATGEIAINIIATVQQPIAERLAQPGADKTLSPTEVASDGVSLADASASMRCSISAAHVHGTHTVFVADVNTVTVVDGSSPLQYHNGQFHEANQ